MNDEVQFVLTVAASVLGWEAGRWSYSKLRGVAFRVAKRRVTDAVMLTIVGLVLLVGVAMLAGAFVLVAMGDPLLP